MHYADSAFGNTQCDVEQFLLELFSHGMQDYKNLTWVWDADRKFRPEGHCLASRGFAECCLAPWGFAEWCKTMIPRDGIFYPHQSLMFDSFSCIPFDFECFTLQAVFITTHNDVDVRRFSIWRHFDVTRIPIQPMQTEFTWKVCFYPTLGWDNMDEIRISTPSENLGFSYPVCNKSQSAHRNVFDLYIYIWLVTKALGTYPGIKNVWKIMKYM